MTRGQDTPPRGYEPIQPLEQSPVYPEGLLGSVLQRLDSIAATVTSPHGRIALLERQVDALVREVRSLANVIVSIDEFKQATTMGSELEHLTVLFVEDEVLLQPVLRRLAKSAGARPLIAKTGRQALTTLETENIDVAVIDLGLPDQPKGMDLARHLHDHFPGIGVVIMTGLLSEADRISAEAMGLRALEKPSHNSEIVSAIREAHGRKSTQPPPGKETP
jgi:CheY-like chemotaxis protein